MKGGIRRKVALLGWSIQRICSDVVAKTRHPAAASANLVLGDSSAGEPGDCEAIGRDGAATRESGEGGSGTCDGGIGDRDSGEATLTAAMAIATAVMVTAAAMMATAAAI
jgi:hypothetical protein